MKIPFRQTTKSGCSFYCLANLFNDPEYIRGVETHTWGSGVADMNKKLEEHPPMESNLYIEMSFATCFQFTEQPNRLIDPLIFKLKWEELGEKMTKGYFRAFIISVKRPVRFHAILVIHDFETDRYIMFDSMQEETQSFTLEDLVSGFHITTVEVFCSWDLPKTENEGNQEVFFNKEYFKHLFENGINNS